MVQFLSNIIPVAIPVRLLKYLTLNFVSYHFAHSHVVVLNI